MRIGFTGTRKGMTEAQKASCASLILQLNITEVHHGDCVGADSDFHDLLYLHGYDNTIHIHPPTKSHLRAHCMGPKCVIHDPQDYLVRDRVIVDNSDLLIATPASRMEELRSGTWYTIRYAKSKEVPMFVVWPDGQYESH